MKASSEGYQHGRSRSCEVSSIRTANKTSNCRYSTWSGSTNIRGRPTTNFAVYEASKPQTKAWKLQTPAAILTLRSKRWTETETAGERVSRRLVPGDDGWSSRLFAAQKDGRRAHTLPASFRLRSQSGFLVLRTLLKCCRNIAETSSAC